MCNLHRHHQGPGSDPSSDPGLVDHTGNLPPLPGVFPDQMAPVVCSGPDGRELAMLRWGFPSPPGVPGNRRVTNIRNTASSFWRAWMKPEHRCLVPVSSFAEYAPGKLDIPHWFALGEDRTLFAFSGLWRPWSGPRGKSDGPHELCAFSTTEPNTGRHRSTPRRCPPCLRQPRSMRPG